MSIEVRDLRFSYGKNPVLRGVSFQAERGELFAVMGPNGAGKSTLFRCILGLLSGYEGEILVDGQELRELTPAQLAGKVAYIPQKTAPVFGYTVEEMVLMGSSAAAKPWKLPGKTEKDRAIRALEQLGLAGLMGRNFYTLSGGEQQLVLIARAFAQEAKILVMDEPSSSLDYGNQDRLFRQLRMLTGAGFLVMVSLHNPQQVYSYADKVLVLRDGAVMGAGVPGDIVTAELLQKLYGIEAAVVNTPYGNAILQKKRK